MQLQLRIPPFMALRDVTSDLAVSGLESVKRELDSIEVPFETYTSLENRMAAVLSEFVQARSACGTDPICTRDVEWPASPADDDVIFIIELHDGYDELLDRMVQAGTQSMRLSLDLESANALDRRVKAGIRETLSKYIFYNPVCGNHEICATSYPVDAWSMRPVR